MDVKKKQSYLQNNKKRDTLDLILEDRLFNVHSVYDKYFVCVTLFLPFALDT